MSRSIANRARSVLPSGIRRFFDIAASMKEVISLGIGEPDFVTPQPIIDAAKASLDRGETGYTSNAGLLELREIIAHMLNSQYGLDYTPSEVLVTVGVSEAMQLSMLALLNPGDEILIPEPCFVSYGPAASFAGAVVKYVSTSADNNFEVTAEDIERQISPRSKMLFLSYPSNPTGAVLRKETLQEIAELVIAHDLWVLSDEIYDLLTYGSVHETGHTCVASLDSLRERTILMNGFSKGYAMTGWRLGYLCAKEPVYDAAYKIHQYMIMSAPTMSQYGAIAALTECQDQVESMRLAYDRRRRTIVDGLRNAGLATFEPEGAFYCFPDIRSAGLESEEFAQRLVKEEQVAAVPGHVFGPSGEGFLRCSYATSHDKIEEAVRRITSFASRCRDEGQ